MTENINTECFENRMKLKEMRVAHRDLDDVIDRLAHEPHVDQLRLRRLKKRRLHMKDIISRLESELIPDLNA
ncbi:MAG: YdcH family protein [Gammaproteobacteria bacterium]